MPTRTLAEKSAYAAGLKEDLDMASLSANTVVQLLEVLDARLVNAAAPSDIFQPLLRRFTETVTPVYAYDYDPALTRAFSRAAFVQPAIEQQASACTEFEMDWAQNAKPTVVCLNNLPPKHAEALTLHEVIWQLYMYATRKKMTLTDSASRAAWDSQAQPGDTRMPFSPFQSTVCVYMCTHSHLLGLCMSPWLLCSHYSQMTLRRL